MTDKRAIATAEREEAFRRWFAAAGMSDPEIWTPVSVLFDSWAQTSGECAAGVAWFARRLRAAGIAPFRTNRVKGLRYQLVDINEIAASITAADLARDAARRANDPNALAAAIRDQMRWRRQAGRLLDVGVAGPAEFKIIATIAQRWAATARLSDAKFEAKIKRMIDHQGGITPQIKTTISPWRIDENGILCRELRAEGVKPILKGERFQDEFQVESRSGTSTASLQRSQSGSPQV